MPCYHPLTAYRKVGGYNPKTGKWPLTFNPSEGHEAFPLAIPCGQCIGCRLEYSRQWATRAILEASLYDNNTFITLTYNNDNLDPSLSLNKRDIQLFLKRLRKKYGEGIRFIQCGEYGSQLQRPHHHAILFNHDFPDKEYWTTNNGMPLYRSPTLEKLWPFGFTTIGGVTFESVAYVCRYITKKISGDVQVQDQHYQGRLPEFLTMSRKPGIGKPWLDKYQDDVYNHDQVIIRDNLKVRPPKYFDNLYDIDNPDKLQDIKKQRIKHIMSNQEEYSPDRLSVKEYIQYLKAQRLTRPIEM